MPDRGGRAGVSVEQEDEQPLGTLGLPGPAGRNLLPYERRLAAWQVKRWRAGRTYDVAKMERASGAEAVRLYAAYAASRKLMAAVDLLGIAAGIALVVTVFPDGWTAFVSAMCVIALGWGIGFIGLVRMFQSDKARKQYQRATGRESD
jgi:hypothetical protein